MAATGCVAASYMDFANVQNVPHRSVCLLVADATRPHDQVRRTSHEQHAVAAWRVNVQIPATTRQIAAAPLNIGKQNAAARRQMDEQIAAVARGIDDRNAAAARQVDEQIAATDRQIAAISRQIDEQNAAHARRIAATARHIEEHFAVAAQQFNEQHAAYARQIAATTRQIDEQHLEVMQRSMSQLKSGALWLGEQASCDDAADSHMA